MEHTHTASFEPVLRDSLCHQEQCWHDEGTEVQ